MKGKKPIWWSLLMLSFVCLSLLVPIEEAWAGNARHPERQTVPSTRTPRPTANPTVVAPTATTIPGATPTLERPESPPAQGSATGTATTTVTPTATATPPGRPTGNATIAASRTPGSGSQTEQPASATPTLTATRQPIGLGTPGTPAAVGQLRMDTIPPLEPAPGQGALWFFGAGFIGLLLVGSGVWLRKRLRR